MYRVGFPGWKIAARLGCPTYLRVIVYRDDESDSFWAKSPDLDGMVVAGQNLDEVFREVRLASEVLMDMAGATKKARTPEPEFRMRAVPCVA